MIESFRKPFHHYIMSLQNEICSAFEAIEGIPLFTRDTWERPGGGGGITRVVSESNLLEGGGVNTSAVHGQLTDEVKRYLGTPAQAFFACGISLVLHPTNPFVPTVHANFRYFELYDSNKKVVDAWFGGGADLTPYYLFTGDIVHFHSTWKDVCDRFDHRLYPQFKSACDRYFYNHHRKEARGVGGIFFDKLRGTPERDGQFWFDFTTATGKEFLKAYLPIAEARKEIPFSHENKVWQEIRRGRYVEFNLLHDDGTRFGIKTDGRTESILMSLPPKVRWAYNHQPDPESEEEALVKVLQVPREWI